MLVHCFSALTPGLTVPLMGYCRSCGQHCYVTRHRAMRSGYQFGYCSNQYCRKSYYRKLRRRQRQSGATAVTLTPGVRSRGHSPQAVATAGVPSASTSGPVPFLIAVADRRVPRLTLMRLTSCIWVVTFVVKMKRRFRYIVAHRVAVAFGAFAPVVDLLVAD